jgi:chromosome segregation ATPase
MDQDQLKKQLEWLESSRREDKQTITSMHKKIADLESIIGKTNEYIKTLDADIAKTSVRVKKIDDFDDALTTHRKEIKKELTAQETRAKKRETYAKEKYEKQINTLNTDVAKIENKIEKLPDPSEKISKLEKGLSKQDVTIAELEKEFKEDLAAYAGLPRQIAILEEDRSADKNQLTDLQGEVIALRKRIEENRAQYDIAVEAQKKTNTRLAELVAEEDKRRERQREFLDEVSRNQLDTEKIFEDWTRRFAAIEERAETLTTALQTYGEIEVSLRKAQSQFEDIIDQITRRIHEITEMQRLGEERFRQEWTTFKSDDQKRWVNYTLTQEEQAKENLRRHDRLNDRLTTIEETFQDLHDSVEQNSEQMETMMQGLMGVLREWLASNERFTTPR